LIESPPEEKKMKKILLTVFVLSLILFTGCQADNAASQNTTNLVTPPPPEPTATLPPEPKATQEPPPTAAPTETPVPIPVNWFNSSWETLDVEIPGYTVQKLASNPFPPSELGIAFDSQDKLYIAGYQITIVDPETGTILQTYDSEDLPGLTLADDLVIGPDGSLYWTDLMSGNLGRLAPDGTVSNQFVGKGINPIAFSGDGRLFVGLFGFSDGLFEVDPELQDPPRKLGGIFSSGLNCFAVGPDDQYLYAPNLMAEKLLKIDLASGEIVSEWEDIWGCVKRNSKGEMHVLAMPTGTLYKITDFDNHEYEIVGEYSSLVPGIDNFAFDSQDNVYISRHNRTVSQALPGGELREVIKAGFFAPGGIALIPGENSDDTLFVGEMLYLYQFDAQTGEMEDHFKMGSLTLGSEGNKLILTSYLNLSVLTLNPGTGSLTSHLPPFQQPTNGILVDKKLIVAEFGSSSVVKATAGEFITEKEVLASGLSAPTGLAASEGKIWVADWETGEIWQIVEGGDVMEPKVLVAKGLNKPEGMAVDIDGSLLVLESGAGRLTRIDPATGAASTVFEGMGVGFEAFADWTTPPHYNFCGVAVGPEGDIYISSDRDQTIYHLQPVP